MQDITSASLDRTLKALKNFAPDISQEMDKEINIELRKISEYAKTLMPSGEFHPSGWARASAGEWGSRLKFNSDKARNKIKPSRGRNRNTYSGFVNRYGVTNPDAAGAIYEMAGRANPNGRSGGASRNPNAGDDFIKNINKWNNTKTPLKNSGRAIYPAVERHQSAVVAAIEASIAKAIIKGNARLGGRNG